MLASKVNGLKDTEWDAIKVLERQKGGPLRLDVDCGKCNAGTIYDIYPITRTDKCTNLLWDATTLSTQKSDRG